MTRSRFGKWMAGIYIALVCSVVFFLLYLSMTDSTTVKQERLFQEIEYLDDLQPETVSDMAAPCGEKRIYTIPLDENLGEAASFAMYAIHSYVKVYIDEELVYELGISDLNKFLKTPGSIWVIVPIKMADHGKNLRVEVTPVYKSRLGKHDLIMFGSRLQIYRNQLRADLPQIMMCLFAIICGVIMVLFAVRSYFKGEGDTANGYLGMFAITLSVWKVLDTRYVPMVINQNLLLSSTISLSMLSLCSFPLLNFMRKQVRLKHFPIIEVSSVIANVTAAIVLFLQLWGIADYRESLPIIHIGMGISIVTIALSGIRAWTLEKDDPRVRRAILCFMCCAVGGVIDLFTFYMKGTSSGLLFTMGAFLFYVVYSTVVGNLELNKRADVDMFTGLYNRSKCNQLLRETDSADGIECALAMFDLNDLKLTNDTYGHEAGDRLILSFVEILRGEAIPGSFLGRYGGDEFIMYVLDVDGKIMNRVMKRIEGSVEKYNRSGASPQISYSAGFVLSSELEDPSTMDLFQEADKRMYVEKKKYHEAHDRRKRDDAK
ncbi:MAG: GGDEF domain-containing protein [Lachnospiraceae bacterium]|nr:GGDEF domain-containing protein [Lachnospiraceae bacterium]